MDVSSLYELDKQILADNGFLSFPLNGIFLYEYLHGGIMP